MAVVTANVTFTFPANPDDLLTQAFCGKYNYQNLIPSLSGLVPNPQSSGDFARSTISGYVLGVINEYNRIVYTGLANQVAASGVNTVLVASGFSFTML